MKLIRYENWCTDVERLEQTKWRSYEQSTTELNEDGSKSYTEGDLIYFRIKFLRIKSVLYKLRLLMKKLGGSNPHSSIIYKEYYLKYWEMYVAECCRKDEFGIYLRTANYTFVRQLHLQGEAPNYRYKNKVLKATDYTTLSKHHQHLEKEQQNAEMITMHQNHIAHVAEERQAKQELGITLDLTPKQVLTGEAKGYENIRFKGVNSVAKTDDQEIKMKQEQMEKDKQNEKDKEQNIKIEEVRVKSSEQKFDLF